MAPGEDVQPRLDGCRLGCGHRVFLYLEPRVGLRGGPTLPTFPVPKAEEGDAVRHRGFMFLFLLLSLRRRSNRRGRHREAQGSTIMAG